MLKRRGGPGSGMVLRRFPAAAMALVFLVSGLGGCLGGDAAPKESGAAGSSSDEPASSISVTPTPGITVAINKGAILGHVQDDAGLSLPGAAILLLEADARATSDAAGDFRFNDLTPRSYLMRTEAQGFRPDEQTVEVRAGNVTTVSVLLLPTEDRGAGYRPHPHDLWGEAVEKTLLETDVEYTGPLSSGNENPYLDKVLGAFYYSNQPSPSNSWCKVPFKNLGAEPEIVLPGTKEVQVTITWQNGAQGSTLPKMGLAYSTANSSTMVFLAKQPPGTKFTIPVTPADTDSGHQRFSLWNFWLVPNNDVKNAPTDLPAVSPGTFHVKIVIIKGDVIPVDPAHEDFWKGNLTKVLMQRGAGTVAAANGRPRMSLPAKTIVPPGTNKLRIQFYWSYNDAGNGTAADRDYVLLWRTADMPPQAKLSEFVTNTPVTPGNHYKVYEVPVKDTETDGYYQRVSMWAFQPSIAGYEKEWYNPDPRGRTFFLHIEALRDPSFA